MKPTPVVHFPPAAVSRCLVALSILAACGLLTSCNVLPQPQVDAVRHFTLSGPVGEVAGTVTVRPVQLAGHLRSRAMAVRIGENEVDYLQDVRWAESLDDAITQLLRARLASVPGGGSVSVTVQRCELVRFAGNDVQLSATYVIRPDGADPAPAKRGAFTASPRSWDGRDYGDLIALLRQAVEELGDAIAETMEAE